MGNQTVTWILFSFVSKPRVLMSYLATACKEIVLPSFKRFGGCLVAQG